MSRHRVTLGDQRQERLQRAASLRQRALDLRATNRRVEAESAARRSLLLFEAYAGPSDPDVANLATVLAGIRASFGDLVEALALCRRAVAIMRAYPWGDKVLVRIHVQSLCTLAHILRRLGNHDDAEAHVLAAAAMARNRLGADDADTLVVENELGVLYEALRRFDEAEVAFRRVLAVVQAQSGGRGASMATVLHNLAGLEHSRGDLTAAELCARRSIELRATVLGPYHIETVAGTAQLGAILADQGRHAQAEGLLRQAIDCFARWLGPGDYAVGVSAGSLAVVLSERGDTVEAERLYRRALAIKTKVLGPENTEVAALANNLAVLLDAEGRAEEAAALLASALRVLEVRLGPHDPATSACAANLAGLRRQRTPRQTTYDGDAQEEWRGVAGPGTDGGGCRLALRRPGNENAPGGPEPAGDGAGPGGLRRQAHRLPLG